MWRYCILSLLIFAGSCNASAQNVVFSASAGANKMGVNDQVPVQYTLQNATNIHSYTKPQSRDFAVVQGPFTSTSYSTTIINGQATTSSQTTFTFILHPTHTGNLTIPPITVTDGGGHSYQSNSLPMQVVSGSVASQQRQSSPFDGFFDDDPFNDVMQQRRQQMLQRQLQARQRQQQQQILSEINDDKDINKNIFIKVDVDKSKVHVGEQITASYKLYARIPMQISISKLPSLNGFWTQDFEMPKGNIKPTEEIVNGKKYQVFLLKKSALFPQQTGTLELDPAEAQGIARIIQHVQQHNPFADMMDDPFMKSFGSLMMNDPFFNNDFFNSVAYKDVEVHLKSTPVKITVTPLPDKGKPADFGGAVGNFTLTSKIDKKDITTDDAAALTINISGSGNLKLIETPKLNLPNGLDTYDPQVIDTITGRTTTISGSKLITYSITPRAPGDYTIPPVSFSYYSPQKGTYVSLSTQPIQLHVRPGKHYNSTQVSNNIALADIHNITTKPLEKLTFTSKPLLYAPAYWSMYGLPLLAFIGFAVWKRRDEELAKDVVKLKNKRANRIALKRLNTARQLLQQNNFKPFYEEVSKAIWLYLSDKFNIPLSALSRETAGQALNNRKIPDALLKKIDRVVSECETALYANSSGAKQMSQTYQDAVNVISELESTI